MCLILALSTVATSLPSVLFDEELTAAVDAMRGEQTRGDWIRELVRDVTLSFPPR